LTTTQHFSSLQEITGKLSMDIIGSCAFGIEAGSFKTGADQRTEFIKMADSIWNIEERRKK
jgi:hypothetical protein